MTAPSTLMVGTVVSSTARYLTATVNGETVVALKPERLFLTEGDPVALVQDGRRLVAVSDVGGGATSGRLAAVNVAYGQVTGSSTETADLTVEHDYEWLLVLLTGNNGHPPGWTFWGDDGYYRRIFWRIAESADDAVQMDTGAPYWVMLAFSSYAVNSEGGPQFGVVTSLGNLSGGGTNPAWRTLGWAGGLSPLVEDSQAVLVGRANPYYEYGEFYPPAIAPRGAWGDAGIGDQHLTLGSGVEHPSVFGSWYRGGPDDLVEDDRYVDWTYPLPVSGPIGGWTDMVVVEAGD